MFKNEQIQDKIDMVDKRSHNAALTIIPTSLLTVQKLARLKFQRVKKFKFAWRSREVYQVK